jgi:hypothetical protein
MPLPAAGMLLALLAVGVPSSTGWLELEASAPVREDGAERLVPVTWVVGFPDTLAGSDTRAILASMAPGQGATLLPRGSLTRAEEDFLAGLRAFMDGSPRRAAEAWARLRRERLSPAMAASLRVNLAVLEALRGGMEGPERLWIAEWTGGGPAAEGAWRNLLALRLAQGRWREADAAIDAMLAAHPRHRLALLAKAALLWRFRSEAEWAAFLKARAEEDRAEPDMQMLYAGHLLRRGRPGDLAEAVLFLDKALAARPKAGRGWFMLAEAQFRQGYHYFALDCLQNAGRAGYLEPDFHELYARVLHSCCTGDEDPRAPRARAAAQELLEKGLEKDLHRRSAAQLLYTLYAQNLKPEAAKELERNLWFHFGGPRRVVPPLGDPLWGRAGIDAAGLRVKPGIYSLTWVLGMRERDVYRELWRGE